MQVPGTFINDALKSTFTEATQHTTPAIVNFTKLEKFRSSKKFNVGNVTPIAVSPFGPLGKAHAGFAYMHADITYEKVNDPKTGAPIKVPGLALVRGDSVAMLPLLHCDGTDYVVMTEQARLPIGETNFWEIPAGMADAAVGKSGYAQAIAKEMEEEVGLTLDRQTEFVYVGKMVPSAGGCDESISCYWSRVNCTPDVLTYLEGSIGGSLEENEQITARIMPLSTVRSKILDGTLTDAKLITTLWFYDNKPELHKWSCDRTLTLGPSGKPQLISSSAK